MGKNEPVVPVPDLDKIIHQSRPIFYKRWFLWFHKEASPTDWIVAVATVFIALSTLAQVCVTVYQWREMHAAGFQADKMIDSANKTEAAAEKSAHASRDFADTAALINQGIQNAVDKLNTQASATTRLATNSENANKYVMQADRPWLGGVLSVADFEVGKKPTFGLIFPNTGKRPALVSLTEYRFSAYGFFPPAPDKAYITDETPSTDIVVPGQSLTASQVADTPLSQPEMDLIDAGQLTYFVFAKVEYRDIQSKNFYWTHVCWRYMPKMKTPSDNGFRNCKEYNEAK